MKNKVLLTLLVVFISMFFCGIVEARECNYEYNNKKLTLTTNNSSSGTTISCNFDGQDCDSNSRTDYTKIYNSLEPTVDEDSCYKTLHVCVLKVEDEMANLFGGSLGMGGFLGKILQLIINKKDGGPYYFLGIFGSSLDAAEIDDEIAEEFDISDSKSWAKIYHEDGEHKSITCKTVNSTDDLPDDKYEQYCKKYANLIGDVKNAYINYDACKSKGSDKEISKCRASAITKINKTSDILKTTCNNIMQNSLISVEDSCIKSCLTASKKVSELKHQYMGETDLNSDCSISDRLINWIRNIVKWVKYIVPVVVIILGILDFLRAIATNNDDNMKKAQGRFIKRLIAAALIFVIPFILEFILDKMGFVYSDCGIL